MSEYQDYLDAFKKPEKDEYQQYLDASSGGSQYSLENMNEQARQQIAPYQELQDRTLNLLAKPSQAAMSVVTAPAAATSNYLQGKPQEEDINPLVHPGDYLDKYGSSDAFFKTLPVGNNPVAYGISPNKIASAVTDIGVTHAASVPFADKIAEGTQSFLTDQAEKNRVKTLTRISGLDDTSQALAQGKINKSVDTLKDYGIADQISNPSQLHETLMGKATPTLDSFGNKAYINEPGLIDKVTKEVNAHIDTLSGSAPAMDANDLVDKIYNDVANRAGNQNSMSSFTGRQDDALLNRIKDIIEPDLYPERSVKDLVQMKRNSADKIWELGSGRVTLPVEGSNEAGIHQALWKTVDGHINDLAQQGAPGALELVQKNNDLSNLLRSRDLTINAPLRDIVSPSIFEAATAQAAGTVSGHAMIGSRPARGLIERQLDVLPARTANMQEGASNMINSIDMHRSAATSIAAGQVQQPTPQQQEQPANIQRIPQSVPDLQQQVMMQKGLVENLAEYKIPRNSEDILNSKKLALAKIAQTTNDPKFVNMLQDALQMHPDQLKNILPVLGTQFPQIFPPDKYNRFNGKIFSVDPMQKQMMIHNAYQDVQNNQSLSNTQKAIYQDGLNRDGSLPDSYQ